MRKIKILDTTLRDGEQAPGCGMHIKEKMEIALALEALGVDTVEAGFAVISEGDFNAVKLIAETLKRCSVSSLARAKKGDIDAAYEAVKGSVDPRIHVFIATSPLHMEYKLKMTKEEVLSSIRENVKYARSKCPNVEFSCEDAMRSEKGFLSLAVRTALEAGANIINIPDTVGYSTPEEISETIKFLKREVDALNSAELSVHCHNDLGQAVALSLAAVKAGATAVECTVNGLGERAGNAALEEVVMGIETRKNFYGADTNIDTTKLFRTSKLVYTVLGLTPPINKAIVGANAFAHEAGIHQHGVLSNPETYEIMTPSSVGVIKTDMVFGKHSGRHAVDVRLKELGHSLTKEEMDTLFEAFKQLADKKMYITDYDLQALAEHRGAEINSGYRLDRFTVNSGNYVTSNAVIRLIDSNNNVSERVAIGDGPIDACFKAIDKIIACKEHSLDDYNIHSVTEGNDALGEVIVRISAGDATVTGRGLSTDIIEASILAYINGLNKLI